MNQKKFIAMNDIQYYEFIPIIICSVFSYFISDISYYSLVYSYQMKKMNLELIGDLELIILFISHILNEKYFFEFKTIYSSLSFIKYNNIIFNYYNNCRIL